MPYKIKELAGKPYQPSNGTEGMMFEAEFCDICLVDEKYRQTLDGTYGCRILDFAMMREPTDKDYPNQWTHDKEGKPICTGFIPMNGHVPVPKALTGKIIFGDLKQIQAHRKMRGEL